ncbi:MAG: L-glutamate gamma-semialdehyde dehydrogenase [Deltaproteobacteria bacterium]|nr:MAG: L-glutamate gamma-semialdehyde dehydrogenase [Deltaproteobacteria bacterium]
MSSIMYPPRPSNEPVLDYAPASTERAGIEKELKRLGSETIEIPLVIGGKEVTTGKIAECRCPHDHSKLLARYHVAGPEHVEQAVAAAKAAWAEWSEMDWTARLSVFLRAAELLAGSWRYTLNAATMLGQSKTVHQAEIDSACELIDFWRFNPWYAAKIYAEQPENSRAVWNYVEYRPLEGFVFAVTPFNFTSIAGNLPTSPAMMGNTVLWKPASSAVYSAWFLVQLWREAGLPDGVINFIPGPGGAVGNPVLQHPELAGVHFTGSTSTFLHMWKTIGANIDRYRSYPRIVGETGGKDFVFVHASADPEATVAALVRGAYEYQGQKCSAASRAYIPRSLWPKLRAMLIDQIKQIRMGDTADFSNFMGAVIDKPAFDKISEYIEFAGKDSKAEILCGGGRNAERGWFIEPTLVEVQDPHHRLMEEEIFGPVLSVFVYPDDQYEQMLETCDRTSPYGLTGAIFATDRKAIELARRRLRHSAGNFYINDKPTGAVVGQQPFGGSRASGTNDKAGSYLNLLRWVSARAIKENLAPPRDWRYPYMG